MPRVENAFNAYLIKEVFFFIIINAVSINASFICSFCMHDLIPAMFIELRFGNNVTGSVQLQWTINFVNSLKAAEIFKIKLSLCMIPLLLGSNLPEK